MRLLFTSVPSHGRFFTLAGLAPAAVDAGHQVAILAIASLLSALAQNRANAERFVRTRADHAGDGA
jgi:hypothetical protein